MSNARQVDLLLSGIFGLNGAPLSGGRVYCYNAGSSTLKNVYNDVGLTVASENPVILDENGKGIKYALGSYKFVIKDANDSTLYTYDNLTYGFNPESVTADYSGSIYLASMGGDSSAMQGSTTLTTPISSLAEGMRFVFQSPFDCADDATIAIDEAEAVALYIADGSGPVTSGYLEEGQFYEIIYDGSVFRVFSSSAEITVDRIPDGSITEDKISTGAITTDKLASEAVTTTKINDGAITSGKIATNAVTESKIDNGAVTEDKIGMNAVTTSKLAAKAVTNANIDDNAVDTAQIAVGAVMTVNINDGAVTAKKLAEKAGLSNLYYSVSEAGTYAPDEDGKIFFNSSASSGSVTIKIFDAQYYSGVPLFFNKQFSGSTLTVSIRNMTDVETGSYAVSNYLVLMKSTYNSWVTLHSA